MSENDVFAATDQILAGFDFAKSAAATAESHRNETRKLLIGIVEILDSLVAMERRCEELIGAGHQEVPARAANIIVRQVTGLLGQAGVDAMNCTGQPLDLARHEVLEVRTVPGATEDTVIEEVVRGYMWRGSPLRQAKVVISAGEGDAGARDT